jgi:rSAM/selenodomain-associated transferase 2
MPVLNEAASLGSSLSNLDITGTEELIVVDGGSSDETVSIARQFTDRVYEAQTGRARVMNFGAGKASGDILLFLHADCALPDNGFNMIRSTLRDNNVSAGGFYLGIDHPSFRFRIIELGANLRSRVSSLIYGDQGMFLRKEVFDSIGGFADMPLMEDIEICQRLNKRGKTVLLRPSIKASPRRWLQEGVMYATLRDWSLAFSYTFLKVPPEKLIKHYKEIR